MAKIGLNIETVLQETIRIHPGLYEATQRIDKWENEEADKISVEIINLVERVMATMELDNRTITHIIRMLRSLLHGFASLEHDKGFGGQVSVDESFNLAMEIMLAGIQAKKASEHSS